MNVLSTHNHKRLQITVVGLVFLASVAGAFLTADGRGLLIFFAIIGSSLGIWLFRNTHIRIVILFASAFLSANFRGLPASIFMLTAILFLWLFEIISQKKPFRVDTSRSMRLAILFGVVSILSFLAGQIPWFPIPGASLEAQLGGLGLFLFSVAAFFVGAQLTESEEALKFYIFSLLVITGGIIFGSSLPVVRGLIARLFSIANGGSMLGIWFTALTASQALSNTQLNSRWRWFLFSAALGYFGLTFLINRSWASGWLPALSGFAVIIWFYKPRLRILTAVAGVIAAMFIWQYMGTNLVAENQYSLTTRLAAVENMAQIIKVNPLLGTGPSNYYWYAALYPLLGFQVQFNSHNQYIDIIAQIGFIGLIVFIWLLAQLFTTAMRLFSRTDSGFARAYGLGIVGGISGMLVAGFLGDWLIPFFYNVGLRGFGGSMLGWFLLGGLVVLERKYLN